MNSYKSWCHLKIKFIFGLLIGCIFGVTSLSGKDIYPAGYQNERSSNLLKKRMLGDLDTIKNIFEVKYAPFSWKRQYSGWQIEKEYAKAKKRVENLKNPTIKDFHHILRDFFIAVKDYHVHITFLSTESAFLPFTVKGAEGRYFVVHTEKGLLNLFNSSLHVGDEIISFNGEPIHKVIEDFKKQEFSSSPTKTDQTLAEIYLTERKAAVGNIVPKGPVKIVVKEKATGELKEHRLEWLYLPEKIPDLAHLGKKQLRTECSIENYRESPIHPELHTFLNKSLLCPLFGTTAFEFSKVDNSHLMSSRNSFIPPLGRLLWKTNSDAIFNANIYLSPSGKRVGYIRIPHYLGDCEEVEEFYEIMQLFESQTDALVIDQINNPGGSLFYVYALASILSNKPLCTPKHHIALTQEEVSTAVYLLPILEYVKDEASARSVFGDTFGGFPVDYRFGVLTKQFCNFLINEWNSGNLFTQPTFLFGVDEICPYPKGNYTKPILMIVNELDFSGGDFFPAIMQDNARATIFGTRTAGAGGYFLKCSFPNQTGIKAISYTASMAARKNQEPLETLGVTPDISYEFTIRDLQENFVDYVKAINHAVDGLISHEARSTNDFFEKCKFE